MNKVKKDLTFPPFLSDGIINTKDLYRWIGGLFMLNIGDFSKIAKVTVKTLRHYDQIGLLKPKEIDYLTGYRKYSILQLTRLNKILFYKDLGFSLKQIFNLVEQDITVNQMKEMLSKNKSKLENDIMSAQKALETIISRINVLSLENNIPRYDIKVIEPAAFKIVYRKMTIPTIDEITFYSTKLYDSLYVELDRIKIFPIGPEMNLYHNTEYTETDIELEFGIAIKGTEEELKKLMNSDLIYREIKDENQTASIKFSGHYHSLDLPIIEGLKWIEKNGCELDGNLRELHLSGKAHINGELQKEAAVELQFPIRKSPKH